MTRSQLFEKYILNNGSYKLVALFVSLVLWVTLLGRKDLILNHEMDIQYLLNPNHVITNRKIEKVQVKISGPRTSLKKFTQTDKVITLNLERLSPGKTTVKINKSALNLPVGVRIIRIAPENISLNIREVKAVDAKIKSE